MPPDGAGLEIQKPKYTPPPSRRTRQMPFNPYVQQHQIPKTELHVGAIPNEGFLEEESKPFQRKTPAPFLHTDAIARNTKQAEAVKAGLRGEFGDEIPNLEQKIRDFDAQIRDLRVQRKATDTWVMRTFSNGNQRLEQIDASEKRIMKERDALRDRMEAILHPEGPKGRKDVIQQARDTVVSAVAQGRGEQERPLSGKDVLRAQRGKLEEQLSLLPKWPLSMLPWNSMAKDRILDALEKNAVSMQEFLNAEHFRAQEAAFRRQTEQK